MTENLPPLPGTEKLPPSGPSLNAYILRGREYLEIGVAPMHPDGKGWRLRLDIAPEDGDVIELRTADGSYVPSNESGGRSKRRRPWRLRPRS